MFLSTGNKRRSQTSGVRKSGNFSTGKALVEAIFQLKLHMIDTKRASAPLCIVSLTELIFIEITVKNDR